MGFGVWGLGFGVWGLGFEVLCFNTCHIIARQVRVCALLPGAAAVEDKGLEEGGVRGGG